MSRFSGENETDVLGVVLESLVVVGESVVLDWMKTLGVGRLDGLSEGGNEGPPFIICNW